MPEPAIPDVPDEVQELSDYGYDCARDISRIVTAFSTLATLLLPICFRWHSRHARKEDLPQHLKAIENSSDQQCQTFWKSRLLAGILLALLYAIYYSVDWNHLEEISGYFQSDYIELGKAFIYPLFSGFFLLKIQRISSQENTVQSGKPTKPTSLFLTYFWTCLALTVPKMIALSLGILVFVYVFWAIRGELVLALIIGRGFNPLGAYAQSRKLAKTRFPQFASLLGEISGRAWFVLFFGQVLLNVTGLVLSFWVPITALTAVHTAGSIVVDTASTFLLAFYDSQILVRGRKFLESIELEDARS